MKNFIITTSINSPTEAVIRYDELDDWTLVVVGDAKSPGNYRLKNGIYLSLSDQFKLGFELLKHIPLNSIRRRNIGYVYALSQGADIIATVDDDNLPLENWGQEIFVGRELTAETAMLEPDALVPQFHNILGRVKNLWPRGFPLAHIRSPGAVYTAPATRQIGVQANVWKGDPDVDALHRLTFGPLDIRDVLLPEPLVLGPGVVCPFNTQNTIFTKETLPLQLLPIDVGRYDDIWASYLAKRVMDHLDLAVCFGPPTVLQERNGHDYMRDFNDEIHGMRHTLDFVHALYSFKISGTHPLEAYACLAEQAEQLKCVPGSFNGLWRAWVRDVERFYR